MGCPLLVNKTLDEEREICLNCPFPRCVLELPHTHPATGLRDILVRQLASQGKATAQLAKLLGLSQRTIQRALNKPGPPQHIEKQFYDPNTKPQHVETK